MPKYASYAWVIDQDYIDPFTGDDGATHEDGWEIPASPTTVDVAGPSDAHPEALARLRAGEGTPFQLWDDDRILYYTGRWFEDLTKVGFPDIEPCDWEPSPLEDYGTPNAGAVIMTINDRQPYMS